MHNKNKLFIIYILLVLTITFVVIFVNSKNNNSNSFVDNIIDFVEKPNLFLTNQTKVINENNQPANNNSNKLAEKSLPSKVDLRVPFTTQAPFTNWDDLHNDGCEEASIISVIYYLQNKTLSKDQAETEIISLVNWQVENFGGHYDLPIAKTAEMVEKYYKRRANYTYDITIDQIKTELSNGNPVIVPLAGRVISNPYYRVPGPVYHMLVIRGFDDNKQQFITNDVGTKHGEGYQYDYQTLYNAFHDMPLWEQNKSILDANPQMIFEGRKAMLIIKNL